MADDIHVSVRSNVSALSADRLHQSLVDMVNSVVSGSEVFLRSAEPKRTGAMEAHTSSSKATEDLVGLIEAKLGITAVEGAGSNVAALKSIPGAQDSSHYPIFVDRGTGVFGPTASRIFARTSRAMVFEEDGRTIFARSVAGQHGQHFMAATEAYAQTLLRTDQQIRIALAEMAAEAAAMLLDELA